MAVQEVRVLLFQFQLTASSCGSVERVVVFPGKSVAGLLLFVRFRSVCLVVSVDFHFFEGSILARHSGDVSWVVLAYLSIEK
jgi:hypothetical protein